MSVDSFEDTVVPSGKAILLICRTLLLCSEAYSEAVAAGKGQALAQSLASADASAAQKVCTRCVSL